MKNLTKRNLEITKLALEESQSNAAKLEWEVKEGGRRRLVRSQIANICHEVILSVIPKGSKIKSYANDFREMQKISVFLVDLIDEKLKGKL